MDAAARLMLLLLSLAALHGCAPTLAAPPSAVRIEIPTRPALPACPPQPHPAATVADVQGALVVQLSLEAAKTLQTWGRQAPACWAGRETLLNSHIEKLENRLRAVGGR